MNEPSGGQPRWRHRGLQRWSLLVLAALVLLIGLRPDWGATLQLLGLRLHSALLARFGLAALAWTLALLGLFSALALPAGWSWGFLVPGWQLLPWRQQLHQAAALLVMPALGEELLFRVALMPSPHLGQGSDGLNWSVLGWGALSLGLFVLYHPLAGRLWYPRGRILFQDRHFLMLCTLLGATFSIAFQISGSLWSPVLVHWVAVSVWLGPLNGVRWLDSA